MAGQRGLVGRLENLQHRRIAPLGLVSNLRTPKGSRPSGFGSCSTPRGPEQSINITHELPDRQASKSSWQPKTSPNHCRAMVFNGQGTDQQALVNRQKPGIQQSNQHSPQGAPSPHLEGPERLKAGQTGAEQREKVARDTDKLPRPHPLWSWTGSSNTSQQERMRKLDHSVTRSFDRSIHRIKHQPTAASARCFSDL